MQLYSYLLFNFLKCLELTYNCLIRIDQIFHCLKKTKKLKIWLHVKWNLTGEFTFLNMTEISQWYYFCYWVLYLKKSGKKACWKSFTIFYLSILFTGGNCPNFEIYVRGKQCLCVNRSQVKNIRIQILLTHIMEISM